MQTQIRMRKNLVAVQKLGKHEKKSALDDLISMPEVSNSLGIVRYVGPEVEDLKVGQKVYFGNKRYEFYMEGMNVLVMDEENVYATIEEAIGEQAPSKEA